MEQGIVFGIQHFSIHDGDGIRTNVFLKGCPLRCLWCHNPEGLECAEEFQYFSERCMHCGRCGDVYEHLPETIALGSEEKKLLGEACPYGALEVVGKVMTTDEVLDEVLQDMRFFQTSRGGITVSGGEPMLQFDFLYELLQKAKSEGLHTALETCGYADIGKYRKVMPFVDEFLWDCKETDDARHRELTGVGNQKILDNLRTIHGLGAHIILRCPIIPGANDSKRHLKEIAELLNELEHVEEWEIMPYHRLGISKEKRLQKQRNHEFQTPSDSVVSEWKNEISTYLKNRK